MKYDFEGRELNIPDNDIERTVKNLKVSREEAIEIWLEDEGYIICPEQEELTQRAMDNRITATIHEARAPKNKNKKKSGAKKGIKEDAEKENIIKNIADLLENLVEDVKITHKTKLISFKIGENEYELNLIKHRKPKEK